MSAATAMWARNLGAAALALALALLGVAGHHLPTAPGARAAPAHAHVHPAMPDDASPAAAGDARPGEGERPPPARGPGRCPLCVLAHALPVPAFAGAARAAEAEAAIGPAVLPAVPRPLRLARMPPARGPPLPLAA